ncbi:MULTISPECIES: hypothetical protein [unclassified Streptomyces]|uniref:hypothetical protein n=1 Tax=unclassified Streptomyces TaxID=2593676 RepID=UPI002B1D574F|nr:MULTISPECIES: hypothetical protein [unclassified Streptomyces]
MASGEPVPPAGVPFSQWQEQPVRGMRALRTNGLVSPALPVDRTAAALPAGVREAWRS